MTMGPALRPTRKFVVIEVAEEQYVALEAEARLRHEAVEETAMEFLFDGWQMAVSRRELAAMGKRIVPVVVPWTQEDAA